MLRRPGKHSAMHTSNSDHNNDDDLTQPLLSNSHPNGANSPKPDTKNHIEDRARFHNPPSRLWLLYKSLRRCIVDLIHHLVSLFPNQKHNTISLLQSQRLDSLRQRINVPFDTTNTEHIAKLKRLWTLSFPGESFPTMINSPRWQDMGWQGLNPQTDFRAGGILSLDLLLYMAEKEPATYSTLLKKKEGIRSRYEYPFAVAGVHLTLLIIEVCFGNSSVGDTNVVTTTSMSAIQHQSNDDDYTGSIVNKGFLKLLGESEEAFERIFVECFLTVDQVFLANNSTYMEFPEASREVKKRLQRLLSRRWVSVDRLDALRTEYL